MKQKTNRGVSAFTRTELVVVIVVLVVLGVLALVFLLASALKDVRQKEFTWECTRNLQYIGFAFRRWAQDHEGHFPASESVTNGGWKELLTSTGQGSNCWKYYAMMAEDLETPQILFCPFDERSRATDFVTNALPRDPAVTYFKDNANVSFFVSATANDPNSILAGDRNLGRGTKPDANYGFSPTNSKGNDVAIPTSGPVSWSLRMHSAGKPAGAGNILLGDGSVQQTTTADVNQTWLRISTPTTNWPAGQAPTTPSIRLVFP